MVVRCGVVWRGTCGWLDSVLDDVVVLVHPLAVALEVDLRGGFGAAGERHGLVLHDVHVVRLHQEFRQHVREGCGDRVRHRGGVLRAWGGTKRERQEATSEREGHKPKPAGKDRPPWRLCQPFRCLSFFISLKKICLGFGV